MLATNWALSGRFWPLMKTWAPVSCCRLARLRMKTERMDTTARAGRWPRISGNTRFAMSADPNGRLFVVASHERGGPHLVLRLEVGRSAVRLDGFAVGPGVLLSTQVRASERGLSLVARRGRREQLLGYATEDLWGPFFGGGVFEACF